MVTNPPSSRPSPFQGDAAANASKAKGPTSPTAVAPPLDWSRVVRRSLRGRYAITFAVAGAAAGTGAAIGWKQTKSLYRSEGMVRIASVTPAVIKSTDQTQPIPMFDSFTQAQGELITSRTVLEPAMNQQIWTTASLADIRPSLEELAGNLKVEVKPRSEN